MTPRRAPGSTARRALVVAFAAIVGAFTVGTGIAQAQSAPSSPGAVTAVQAAAISDCSLSDLPSQAGDTVDLIHSGGPFPYPDKDGTVFDNREGLLPAESDGYYHEYTVPTPDSPDRGARRIVTGGSPLTDPAHYYYTGDHYESFCEISDAGGGGGVPACTSVPSQVGDTIDLVEAGGPFDYPQDGEVYQNREGVLPDESAGYYHLYVVPTPGTDGDGNRRLITGSDGEYYYTPDDYTTFCVL